MDTLPTGKVIFYDPHPGLAGCIIPLSDHMKTIVNWLDGQKLNLDECIEILTNAADDAGIDNAVFELHDGFITMARAVGDRINCWRLIRFRG